VTCAGSEPLILQAKYDGINGRLRLPIECQPAPARDWEVEVSASSRFATPSDVQTITVRAKDGSGVAVPDGTNIVVEITGEMRFQNGSQQTSRETQNGEFTLQVIAPESEGQSAICANFADERRSAGQDCVTVSVRATPPEGNQCLITFGSNRTPADGQTFTPVTFSVSDASGQPVEGAQVSVQGTTGLPYLAITDPAPAPTPLTIVTDSNGDAAFFLRSPAGGAAERFTASATFVATDGTSQLVSCDSELGMTYFPAPACLFGEVSPSVIGIAGSDLPQRANASVCFEFQEGDTIGNKLVSFSLVQAPADVTLTSETALIECQDATAGGVVQCCAETGVSSGVGTGIAVIEASLPFGTTASTCASSSIGIGTSTVSEAGINLNCDSENIGGLLNSYNVNGAIDVRTGCESFVCSGYVRNRFGVGIANKRVSFALESGLILEPEGSVLTNDNGEFTMRWDPNGVLPRDVEPLDDEPQYDETDLLDQDVVVNARDTTITILAYMQGQERFDDINSNGVYDDGEVFWDTAEPFMDSNENNVLDPELGEYFIDTRFNGEDADGEWTPANGQWDANTIVSTKTWVTLSGGPDRITGTSTVTLTPDSARALSFEVCDFFGNAMNQTFDLTADNSCEGVEAEFEFSRSDRSPIPIGRIEVPYSATGQQVIDEEASYFEYQTAVDYQDYDPCTIIGVNLVAGEDAIPQNCNVALNFTMNVSEECAAFERAGTIANIAVTVR
jgi:hypothetical protein